MDPQLSRALEGLKATYAPRRVGRYQLTYKLAQGGMGAVFLGRMAGDGGFSKVVAVKVLHPHVQDDQNSRAMFLDEARITAQLEHPNVCRVTDFGDEDGTWYLTMEYLHGEPLRTLITSSPEGRGIPFAIAARVIADAARGLHAAHEMRGPDGLPAGVIHRDVSPSNVVVLYDGVAKVLDFGIAKSRTRIANKTRDGTFKGNFGYVSPEHFNKTPVDRRTDVYSLGVCLWEATVGQRAFQGSFAEAMGAVLLGVRLPSTVLAGYPKELEQIVMRAVAINPDDRYPTTEAMARDLERWIATSGAFVGTGEVADFVKALFSERREWREQLLRQDPDVSGAQPRVAHLDEPKGGAAANDWVDLKQTIPSRNLPKLDSVGVPVQRSPATTAPSRPSAVRAAAGLPPVAASGAAAKPDPDVSAPLTPSPPAPQFELVSAARAPRGGFSKAVIALVVVAAIAAIAAVAVVMAGRR